MDLSVIIVTYNSASCIEACLASVAEQEGLKAETILVDNASADKTLALVRAFPVQVIANTENIGYGRANNQGFDLSKGRNIYLLNPDTRLVEKHTLLRLCETMEAHPRWGLPALALSRWKGKTKQAPPWVIRPSAMCIAIFPRCRDRLPGCWGQA